MKKMMTLLLVGVLSLGVASIAMATEPAPAGQAGTTEKKPATKHKKKHSKKKEKKEGAGESTTTTK